MNAMLLCAGLGTRFQPTTHKLAKPVIPFLNVPLMGFSLYHLEKVGLKQLYVNTHHLPKTVERCLNGIKGDSYKVQYSFEQKILGSGGGIKNIESSLKTKDDFIVANGDEVILFGHSDGFKPLIEFHKKSKALATLLTTNHPDAGVRLGGVWCDDDFRATKLGGQSNQPDAKHFAGVFVLNFDGF